jgi:hypothetical protein
MRLATENTQLDGCLGQAYLLKQLSYNRRKSMTYAGLWLWLWHSISKKLRRVK